LRKLTFAPPRVRRHVWGHRHWVIPSWLLSLLLHGGTLYLLWTYIPRWQTEPVGFGGTSDSALGVEGGSSTSSMMFGFNTGTGDDEKTGDGPEATSVGENTDPVETPTEVQTTAVMPLTAAPVLPSLDGYAAKTPVAGVSGTGTLLPTSAVSNPRDLINSGSGSGRGPGGTGSDASGTGTTGTGGGIPGTAFMGTYDRATRVVFVIDSSASMFNHQAMLAAKAALISSLQTLSDAQQFQVIFYNDTPTLLRLRGERDPTLAFATDVNKSLARQEIAAVVPSNGTNHIDALKLALRLGPEVIYFLTDAAEPALSAAELDQLHRANQGRARIHTIEFGVDAALNSGVLNFLQKLSRQNGGTHRYHNVLQLAVP
jgi:hypothetical protein